MKVDPILRPYIIKLLTQGLKVGVKVIFKEDDFSFAEYDFSYSEIIAEKYIKTENFRL